MTSETQGAKPEPEIQIQIVKEPGPVQIIKETEIKIVEVEKNNVVDSNEILAAIAKLN